MKLIILKTFALLFTIGVSLSSVDSKTYTLNSIFNTTTNVANTLKNGGSQIISRLENKAIYGKNLFISLFWKAVLSIVNSFCATFTSMNAILPQITPHVDDMKLRLITECQNYTFSILKVNEICKSPHFDPSKKVVVIISGWKNTITESDMIYEISKAYLCRGGVNVLALDAAHHVNTLYTWSALNVNEIGRILSKGLIELEKVVPLENIHLIGHSLGANIAGYAGKYFISNTGKLLPRITALDPARPCFNKGGKLSGVKRGDAEFVDVIHSNPGILGIASQVGDVDFYPGGTNPIKKGCFGVICSHSRSYEYYAETVYPDFESNLMAVRCDSLANVRKGFCIGRPQAMGYNISTELKGNYFSDPDGEFPFGISGNQAFPNISECGLCHSQEANNR